MLNPNKIKDSAIPISSQLTVKNELSILSNSSPDNYRNLISMLLTYPNKAEEILATNQELINSDLIAVMEQVASQMSQSGSIEAAILLQQYSEQLKQLKNPPLDKTQKQAKTKSGWQWTIVLGIILVLGGIGWSIYSYLLPSQPIETAQNPVAVSKPSPPVNTKVAALGRIQPKGKIISLSGSSALQHARVAEVLVKEGERVQKGQTIAILDNLNQLKAAVEEAKLNVQVSRSRLERVKAGESKQGEIAAQKARIANLENEFQGEINTQQARIARLEAELKNAQTELSRFEYLYQQGGVSSSEIDSRRLRVRTLQAEIDQAQATLNQIQSTFPERITEAKATLNELQEVRPVNVKVAQSELEQAIAAIPQAEADLELAYVRAPVDGQILRIHTFAGENIRDLGIVDLAQTQEIYVVAEVYETDIGRISKGQKATISSSALPRELKGTVEQIGLQVGKKEVFNNDPTLDIDARVVEVKIRLETTDIEVASKLIDLQVEVKIDLES